MHSPNVVRLVMAESGRGQEVVSPLSGLPKERGALAASTFKNKVATPLRAVSISFYFQGQDSNINTTLSFEIIGQHILYYRHGTN